MGDTPNYLLIVVNQQPPAIPDTSSKPAPSSTGLGPIELGYDLTSWVQALAGIIWSDSIPAGTFDPTTQRIYIALSPDDTQFEIIIEDIATGETASVLWSTPMTPIPSYYKVVSSCSAAGVPVGFLRTS
jgi:hypothetical protein